MDQKNLGQKNLERQSLVKKSLQAIAGLILRCVALCYAMLPRRAQLGLGHALGTLLYWSGFRAAVVKENLRLAFPRDLLKRQKCFRQSYESLGNLFLEFLLVFRTPLRKKAGMRAFVHRFVDYQGQEHLDQAWAQGRRVIFLASHLGNWEVMAAAGNLLAGADLMLVTKRIKPAWLHEEIEEGRASYGVSASYEPQTLRKILAHFKKPNAAVGFVLDQYVGPPVGVRVPLFGVPVGTALAVAAIAKRTDALVMPVENYRKSDGRWQIILHPPLPWAVSEQHSDPHYELALNTARFTQCIEAGIERHPEQWLWVHRRFKGNLQPLAEGEWSEARVRG